MDLCVHLGLNHTQPSVAARHSVPAAPGHAAAEERPLDGRSATEVRLGQVLQVLLVLHAHEHTWQPREERAVRLTLRGVRGLL